MFVGNVIKIGHGSVKLCIQNILGPGSSSINFRSSYGLSWVDFGFLNIFVGVDFWE